jgi:D-arginine dehydrogenase
VVGYDDDVEGFFWLTGQGGYGIQTAPGLSALAAALVLREAPPPELEGFDPALLSPSRL